MGPVLDDLNEVKLLTGTSNQTNTIVQTQGYKSVNNHLQFNVDAGDFVFAGKQHGRRFSRNLHLLPNRDARKCLKI